MRQLTRPEPLGLNKYLALERALVSESNGDQAVKLTQISLAIPWRSSWSSRPACTTSTAKRHGYP
jgi:hypothetical protein